MKRDLKYSSDENRETFPYSWGTTKSEVRWRYAITFGLIDKKEWEDALDVELLEKRNKELKYAMEAFGYFEQ